MDDRLEQQIASARREKRKFALLFVDLNKFKPINDTFGHETGDFVLKTFALRLSQILRQSDTVSRVGGDEYVIMLPNTQTYKDAQNVREKIINLSQIPFSINEQDIFLTCSVGIALFPDDGESKDALYTAADNSMYKEKKS
jgi:diguanylate cyclase (GGDEF)-like protein